jgi:hypothetical protein
MTALTVADLRRRALANLIPPPRMPLSACIEANSRLPEGVSALPGAAVAVLARDRRGDI